MNGTALLTGIPQPDGLKPIQFVVKDVDRLRDTLKDTFGFKRIEELKGGIEKSDFEKKLDDGNLNFWYLEEIGLEIFVLW